MSDSCSNCKFYMNSECHRMPPVVAVDRNKTWPQTEAGDWCGEHAPSSNALPQVLQQETRDRLHANLQVQIVT
jgi:hypothetical protein